MSDFMSRVASAPISWGICEVPGWGAMLPTPRVLAEMSGLGLPATELGAPGFLPDSPEEVRAELAEFNMSLIGGFTPLVLQDPSQRDATIAEAKRVASLFERAGATKFITAAVVDMDWSEPKPLSPEEVRHMSMMFSVVDEICAEHGLEQVLHSHVFTTVENDDDVKRVLDTCDVHWCLDTGHLAIGGTDPVKFAQEAFDRVGHVHLKDVNLSRVPALMSREVSIMESVQQGLFTPLGQGDVDIAGVITTLESRGYNGWYVIEQDTAITDGLPAEGAGPITEVITSLDFLRNVVAPHLVSN
jgi:inosose dehydratase